MVTACNPRVHINRFIVRKPFAVVHTLLAPLLAGLLLLATAAELPAGSGITEYRPTFQPFYEENGTLLAAVRRYRRGAEDFCLVLDPDRFTMAILPANKVLSAQKAAEEKWHKTPFHRSLIQYTSPPHLLRNAGLRRGSHPVQGVFLTADLCPSRKSLDRPWIEATASLPQEAPVPLALMVSGLWIRHHAADISWIKEQTAAGRLSITWGNHSFSHFYDPIAPLEKNFLLSPGTDFIREALLLESLLIENGLLPSPYFRFPGLVSNRNLIENLRNLRLLPIGCDAWLAKGEPPRSGSVILVHGNQNEPEGIRRLMGFYNDKQTAFERGEIALLPLRDAFPP
jgi:hypothetical protein